MKLLATPLFEMDPQDAIRQGILYHYDVIKLFTGLLITPARADIITDFLEVAFHLILYTRNIYPAGNTIRPHTN